MKSKFVAIVFLMVGIFVGCQTANTGAEKTDPVVLGGKPVFENYRAYHRLLTAEAGSGNVEKERIEYLLERIGDCNCHFIRNGKEYSSERAIVHLKWKHVLNKIYIKTAEDFIAKAASSSKMSGKPYLIKLENNEVYPLALILHNELDLLDKRIGKNTRVRVESGSGARS